MIRLKRYNKNKGKIKAKRAKRLKTNGKGKDKVNTIKKDICVVYCLFGYSLHLVGLLLFIGRVFSKDASSSRPNYSRLAI